MSRDGLKFQQIEHTADVGLKIFGVTLKKLFENAAEGLFDVITDLSKVHSGIYRQLNVTSTDCEGLLVDWLSELNYLFLTQRIIFCDFTVEKISATNLTATITGEPLDCSKHEIYTEVKAVTYHGLYIKSVAAGFEAQVILDL